MVIEAGVIAGYVIAWAVRKARRIGRRLDDEFDEVTDTALEKLHAAIATKLGSDPALEDLDEEAGLAARDAGQVSELTRQRVELAITAAARKDDSFGQTVTDLLKAMRQAERSSGQSVIAGTGARIRAKARDSGIAVGTVGRDVHVHRAGGPFEDPPVPGRSGR